MNGGTSRYEFTLSDATCYRTGEHESTAGHCLPFHKLCFANGLAWDLSVRGFNHPVGLYAYQGQVSAVDMNFR